MPRPLGVQLYTFRDPARFGGVGLGLDRPTLEAIAGIGFLGVETVDVPGSDPVAARRVLEAVGLAVTSAHTWARPADGDGFERAAAGAAALGAGTMIVSGAGFTSVAAVEAFADDLNGAAAVAARHGLRLGYHNHDAEMRRVEGIPVYRRLLERLDPSVVFQVDVFWVAVGGADASAVIGELGARVVSLHLKDGLVLPGSAAGGEPFVNVAVGDGVVDIASAVAAGDALPGVAWSIVEFDHVDGSPLEAVTRSYANLTARGLGRGRAT